MNRITKLFKYYIYSRRDKSFEILKELSIKLLNGNSESIDLKQWDKHLNIFNDECSVAANDKVYNEFKTIFFNYLLKHYPKDKRLEELYINDYEIYLSKKNLYRKMLELTFGEVLNLVKLDYFSEEEYRTITFELNKYISSENNNTLLLTDKCNQLSNRELHNLLVKIKKDIPSKSSKQILWHNRVDNLDSFNILNKLIVAELPDLIGKRIISIEYKNDEEIVIYTKDNKTYLITSLNNNYISLYIEKIIGNLDNLTKSDISISESMSIIDNYDNSSSLPYRAYKIGTNKDVVNIIWQRKFDIRSSEVKSYNCEVKIYMINDYI